MAPRRAGEPVGAEGLCGEADLYLRDRRHDRDSEKSRGDRGPLDRLREFFRDIAREIFSQGGELADAGAEWAAATAFGGRASGSISRWHLFLHRPRPTVGREADQEGLDGAPGGVQTALHRSGNYNSFRRARHQVCFRDAEATAIAV